MAFSFPLALNEFFENLPINSTVPDLSESLELNRTGAGEILTADLGPRLWKMEVNISVGSYAEIEQVKARLNVLRQAGASLLAYSIPLLAPQYDPDGSILGASTITLTGVSTNNRDIQLSGFPVGYKLMTGDFLSFTYGSNPTRYAMHQVVNGATANGSGVMTLVEVAPFIRVGFALTAQVRLIKPVFKAVIVPGSVKPPSIGSNFSTGLAFSLIQTLR